MLTAFTRGLNTVSLYGHMSARGSLVCLSMVSSLTSLAFSCASYLPVCLVFVSLPMQLLFDLLELTFFQNLFPSAYWRPPLSEYYGPIHSNELSCSATWELVDIPHSLQRALDSLEADCADQEAFYNTFAELLPPDQPPLAQPQLWNDPVNNFLSTYDPSRIIDMIFGAFSPARCIRASVDKARSLSFKQLDTLMGLVPSFFCRAFFVGQFYLFVTAVDGMYSLV